MQDEVLSGNSRPMLSLARRALWNAERRELHELIKRCAPSLAQVYKRLIDELEMYSEDAVSVVADSRIISWCFEELGSATAGQGKETLAFEGNDATLKSVIEFYCAIKGYASEGCFASTGLLQKIGDLEGSWNGYDEGKGSQAGKIESLQNFEVSDGMTVVLVCTK